MRPDVSLALLFFAASALAEAPVAKSSSTAPTHEVAGHGFKVGGSAPKAKLVRRLHAVIHKDGVDWEPLSIREGGVPGSADNEVSLKVLKIAGHLKGERSKSAAVARLHSGVKDSQWLVISVYPKALERRRTHIELRFRVFEGYVEDIQAAAVTITDRRRSPSSQLPDSFDLRREGVAYQEDRPGSGQFVVAELDPRPVVTSKNSGHLENAEFADSNLGFVSVAWSVKGVETRLGIDSRK